MKTEVLRAARKLGTSVRKHSPLLLTIGAIAGVGAVIFTTSKAAVKTKEEVGALKYEHFTGGGDNVLPKKEVAKVVAKNYWPVAVTAAGTVGCIIFNHKITSSRIQTATALAGVYKEAYDTYREKVRERIGDNDRRELEADIAADKVREAGITPDLIPGEGVLFIESLTGQVFRSSVDDIRREERRYNDDLRGSDWLSINEWLCHLGLNQMEYQIGENLGFVEKYDKDGLNIIFTPSDRVFATGETATVITYEDTLVSYGDFECLNTM